jgi:reactive intermediate/imine deaminase
VANTGSREHTPDQEEQMKPELITSPVVPPPAGPYSPALRVGDWVLLAGQGGADPDTGKLGETIEEQTEQTLRNISLLLEAAGCTLADVVSSLVHLSDLSLFRRYNEVYGRHFGDPKPVRTTVGAELLHGMLIEITVTARHPG